MDVTNMIAKARRTEKAIRTLIGDEAELLMEKDPSLTPAQARVEVRNSNPIWKDLERKATISTQRTQALVAKASKKGQLVTLADKIDEVIEARGEWFALQPGTFELSRAQRRTRVRQSDDGRDLMRLRRSTLATEPFGASFEKSGEHADAFAVLDRWSKLHV